MSIANRIKKLGELFHYTVLPRRVIQTIPLIFNIKNHFRFRAFLKTNKLSFLNNSSYFQFKYCGNYLSSVMSFRERFLTFSHHYDFIHRNNLAGMTAGLANKDKILYSWENVNIFSIRLGLPELTYLEGEFILKFYMNSECIYFLTFCIAPGALFEVDDANVIFIGGSQGAKNKFEYIQIATKLNFDISPQAIILTSLRAIAIKFGLQTLIGIGAIHQCSLKFGDNPSARRSIYDNLWISSGGVQNSSGDFIIPSFYTEKPIYDVKRGHRIRTRRKRLFKQFINDQILQSMK